MTQARKSTKMNWSYFSPVMIYYKPHEFYKWMRINTWTMNQLNWVAIAVDETLRFPNQILPVLFEHKEMIWKDDKKIEYIYRRPHPEETVDKQICSAYRSLKMIMVHQTNYYIRRQMKFHNRGLSFYLHFYFASSIVRRHCFVIVDKCVNFSMEINNKLNGGYII